MKKQSLAVVIALMFLVLQPSFAQSFYDLQTKTLMGDQTSLKQHAGKVALVVNTASKCGLTPQYEGLQTLYEMYAEQGFTVLAFPSNDFLWQEPGSGQEIQEFCDTNYGVTFPMFEKNPVTGEEIQPVYEYLMQHNPQNGPEGEISWNFEKFLVDRMGQVRYRFSPSTKPRSEEVMGHVLELLDEPNPNSENP